MEYLEQVHLFATKWIEKFRDQKISYKDDFDLPDDKLFDFLMTTKKSTSHDALRIVLVDFFCKDIKIDIHISPQLMSLS